MRIAYLECFSGMSGDMFLGALVDAGVSPRLLQDTVAALGVGARLEISRVVRSGISATKVDVWVDGEKDSPRDATARERIRHIEEKALSKVRNPRTETGTHGHGHTHAHEHERHDDPGDHHGHEPERHVHDHEQSS